MDFFSNLEAANFLQPDQALLCLSGWVFARDGSAVQAIRLRKGEQTVGGYYGIRRPDVAQAHSDLRTALFSGFSILSSVDKREFPCALEVQDASLNWHKLKTIEATEFTGQVVYTPLPTELEGLQPKAAGAHSEKKRPILFISHDFAFAGAQMLLLRLLRWLRAHSDTDIEILVATPRSAAAYASSGERNILAGFAETGPVHFLSDLTRAPENLSRIQRGHYRLIYANTGTLGWLLPSLRPFDCPLISHVHELGFWLKRRTGVEIFNRQAAETDLFLAGGQAVQDLLVNEMSVPALETEVVHCCASTERARQARQQHTRAEVRHSLGIPPDAFVLEACGTLEWRKGAELFVPICVALRRKLGKQTFRAIWIGDPCDLIVRDQFLHDIAKAGLTENVSLVEPQQNLPWWMLAADCLALPSREDPFPMVMLEAGVLGLPVVGFQSSGGVTEFVGTDAGIVVPYLDVEAFADALASLALDAEAARRLGQISEQRVMKLYDEEISFRRILTHLDRPSTRPRSPARS